MNYDEWRKYDFRALLWIVDARIARVEQSVLNLTRMVQQLGKLEAYEMSALDDVKQSVQQARDAAQQNADAEQAAVGLIHRLMDMISNAAASATDLADLKSSIDTIAGQVKASADDLGAAVAATP